MKTRELICGEHKAYLSTKNFGYFVKILLDS